MLSSFLKNISILKKFLFVNFLVFIIIGSLTVIYLKNIQPNLINKKTSNHIQIINNTINHINRLKIQFNKDDIRKFLFSTRFLFQNLDRVMIFDDKFELIGDTDTLDLDPRSFSQKLNVVEMDIKEENNTSKKIKVDKEKKNQSKMLSEIIIEYSNSSKLGTPYSFTEENYNQFLLITIKNVNNGEQNIGYLAISEKANDIRNAINERKIFVFRTALVVVIVILIFSLILNRYFLKPIKTLVDFTKSIKEKKKESINIQRVNSRKDEIGILSNSLDDMTKELNNRINAAENFSTDLVHEIRNPLASLKSASEIISETKDKDQRKKLVDILLHDVERIERLITDYSQMLKDEVAITNEQMKKIDLKLIATSVVDDFNSIHNSKSGIKIVQSMSLGGRHRVVWIRVQGRELILGVTLQQISLLAEWKSDKIEESAKLDEFQDLSEQEPLGSQFSRFKKFFMEY